MINKKKVLQVETKTSLIYKYLKRDIINGKFRSGEKLVASKLASHFGVSAIPVREAFNQLMAEGFLENVPHTGVYVQEIDFDYLQQIYPVRGILEGYATRIACPHLTKKDFKKLYALAKKIENLVKSESYSRFSSHNYDFHMTIYKASNNDYLVKIIDDMIKNTSRVRVLYDLMPERAVHANFEHEQIIKALEKYQEKEAESLMQTHIGKTLDYLLKKR